MLLDKLYRIKGKLFDLKVYPENEVVPKEVISSLIFRLETGVPHLQLNGYSAIYFSSGTPGSYWTLKWYEPRTIDPNEEPNPDLNFNMMKVNICIQVYTTISPYRGKFMVPAFIHGNDINNIKYPNESLGYHNKQLSEFNLDDYGKTWYFIS